MEAPVSRTRLLQEIRKMRFDEAYAGWQEKRLTQEEAALVLGVTDRSFRRYVVRYEAEGLEGLIDRRLEALSARGIVQLIFCKLAEGSSIELNRLGQISVSC